MSKLAPCPSCLRHIRVTSAACPFCDAAVAPSALAEAQAARRAPVQKGVKRAVLFAIGAGLTSAACADGEQSDTSELAPVDTTDPTSGGNTSAAATTTDTTELAQPVYGAPVDTTEDGTDTTELAQPEYGAPVLTDDVDTTELAQPLYGAPIDTTEVADAGADASADASLVDGGEDSDTTQLAQPVYGAPIDTTDDTSTKDQTQGSWNEGDGGGGLIVPLYGALPGQNQ